MFELILVLLALIAAVMISVSIAISKSSELSDLQILYKQEKSKANSALYENKQLEKKVAEYNATIEFTLLAEASDYRQTLAIKGCKAIHE